MMHWTLYALAAGLLVLVGVIIGRTVETILRENEQLREAWGFVDANFSTDISELEALGRDDDVTPADWFYDPNLDVPELYDALQRERRNRGE